MSSILPGRRVGSRRRPDAAAVSIGAVIAVGAVLWWLSATFPAELPPIAPWEFSWIDFLGITLPLVWYARGLAPGEAGDRPHGSRQAAFLSGIVLIYAVLQTRFLLLAQHMFLLNRLQQMVLHHLGPFLIAWSWPGEVIARGAPAFLPVLARSRLLQAGLRVVQQPVIAGLLFVGLFWLWLLPGVHFAAMLSPVLYRVMNLSMLIDGLMFWFLVLDPRPAPPARHSFTVRLVTVIAVIFPELLIGAHITFSQAVLYPSYDLAGRFYQSVGALLDQHLGGVVIWIPSSLTSSVAFLLIINNVRLHEDRQSGGKTKDDIEIAPGVRLSSNSWTGR